MQGFKSRQFAGILSNKAIPSKNTVKSMNAIEAKKIEFELR
jgi:hypothetical protein